MPVLSLSSITNSTPLPFALDSRSENVTEYALKVVCAWPVSGQYGPGSRVLYYVLIATCVFGRRVPWLVNPCIAAALLWPAVAAVHGIVLASVHQAGAVDLDIYGAFQLCSIGIMAAPVTVMLSQTYFNDPGRNTIFIWVLLIFVGLLSLAIEFYRLDTFDCLYTNDQDKLAVSHNPLDFPYGQATTCGLKLCSAQNGPESPIRGGAADNYYVIPAPQTLTFGASTLLASGCCLHALLCLVLMWGKVVETYWKRDRDGGREMNAPIEGANGATEGTMKTVNGMIRYLLSMVAIPIFGGAGIAILIVGEINFFSKELLYQTEPMASIGQWAPVAGTFMAMMGSLYLLLAHEVEAVKRKNHRAVCKCAHYHHTSDQESAYGPVLTARGSLEQGDSESLEGRPSCTVSNGSRPFAEECEDAIARVPTEASAGGGEGDAAQRDTLETTSRVKVTNFLVKVGEALGSPPKGWNEDPLEHSYAESWLSTPGEPYKNKNLAETTKRWEEGVRAARSSSHPPNIMENNETRSHSHTRSPNASSPPRSPSHKRRSSTFPTKGRRSPSETGVHEEAAHDGDRRPHQYGSTLKVPSAAHLGSSRIISDVQRGRTARRSSSPAMGQRPSFGNHPNSGESPIDSDDVSGPTFVAAEDSKKGEMKTKDPQG